MSHRDTSGVFGGAGMDRRSVLKTIGVSAAGIGGATSLAGCIGADDEDDPIKIGQIGFETGAGAIYYSPGRWGAEQLVELINDAGGLDGRPIEIIDRDEAGDVVELARELALVEEVDVIIGTAASDSALAIAGTAEEHETLFLQNLSRTPLANYDDDGNLRRHVFKTNNTAAAHYGIGLATYIQEHFPDVERIGYLFQDYAWGHETMEYFDAARQNLLPDTEVVRTVLSPPFPDEFGAYVDELAGDEPDMVVTSYWGGVSTAFTTTGLGRGFFDDVVVASYTGNFLTATQQEDVIPEVEGHLEVAFGYHVLPGMEDWESEALGELDPIGIQEFANEYRERADRFVTAGVADGSGSIAIFAKAYTEAAERVGGVPDTEDLIESLEGIEVQAPLSEYRIRPEDHRTVQPQQFGLVQAVDDDWRPYVQDEAMVFGEEIEVPPDAKSFDDVVDFIANY